METEKEIVNRVSNSALITFDLEQYYQPGDRVEFDIKDILFQGLILREKDFRDYIKAHDWSQYRNKFVAIYCSADAVIPTWAFMLLTIVLEPFAKRIVFGTLSDLETRLFEDALSKVDWEKFKDAKVVIKGCSKVNVPSTAYVEVSARLRPYATSLMFGEACSTVPLYKRIKS